MKISCRKQNRGGKPACLAALLLFAWNLGAEETNSVSPTNAPAAKPERPPETSRDFFNAGTRMLREGKLREAETFLQTAAAKQNESVRSPAVYNLGHVRFGQGAEELKKSLLAGPTASRGRSATQRANRAVQQADAALASQDMQKMVAAYREGRGARKELKAATEAVQRALEAHGVALRKWQRSLGDFQSAVELNPADADARQNAEVVERAIAKLVDSIREMQQTSKGMGQPQKELGEKLKQLRGQIPEPLMPPGAAGDDEEDEDGKPFDPKESDREGPNREGQEMTLTRDQAGWILDAFKLGGDRRLPMGEGDKAEPKNRNQRNW